MALQSFAFVLFLAVITLVLLIGFLVISVIQNALFTVAPKYVITFDSKFPIVQIIYILFFSMFFIIFLLLALAIRKVREG